MTDDQKQKAQTLLNSQHYNNIPHIYKKNMRMHESQFPVNYNYQMQSEFNYYQNSNPETLFNNYNHHPQSLDLSGNNGIERFYNEGMDQIVDF